MSCLPPTRLCATLKTVVCSIIVKIKFLKLKHTFSNFNILFQLFFVLQMLQLVILFACSYNNN